MNKVTLINYYLSKKDFKKYLEIGVHQGHSYSGVDAIIKDSVDPDKNSPAIYHLTSDEFFERVFPEHFVLFKPKDIVSGDFYWAYQTKSEKTFWVAADCTGHGVPGSFMTMIGNSLLNEIIIENGIEDSN
jgi:hypothetical protein